MNSRKSLIIAAIAGLVVLASVIVYFLYPKGSTYTVQTNERALIFSETSGLEIDNVIGPGTHRKDDDEEVIIIDVSEQVVDETLDVLTRNGLVCTVEVSVRFYPKRNEVGLLYERFRGNYQNMMVAPEVRAGIRKVMGRHSMKEIYVTKRSEIESKIVSETKKILASNYVEMTSFLVRSIELPDKLKDKVDGWLNEDEDSSGN